MTATIHSFPDRPLARGRRAFNEVIENGGGAIEASLAMVAAAFDDFSIHNTFKQSIRRYIELGTGHPEVRARFGRRLAMLRGYDIDAAVYLVERALRAEHKAFQLAQTYGYGHPRLSLEVLRELRLMLRLARRYATPGEYRALVDLVLGESEEEGIAS